MASRSARSACFVIPSLAEVEAALGEPASAWTGRCYEIACAIVERRLVRGIAVAVYGHWTGPISPSSPFADRRGMGFCQHGWISLADGRVVDPTRWVFEAVEPYLYVGAPDHYDEGGNQWRMAMAPPMPAYREECSLPLDIGDSKACAFVRSLLPPDTPSRRIGHSQACWIANRSPSSLAPHARAIYAWLECVGYGAFIPFDNKRMVDDGREPRGAG